MDPPQSIKQFLKANNMGFEGLFGINKTMRFREFLIVPKDKLYIMGTAGDNPFVGEATTKNNMEDIMLQRGKNDKVYFISDRHESQILKTLKSKVMWGIYGGSFLAIVCLMVILIYLRAF